MFIVWIYNGVRRNIQGADQKDQTVDADTGALIFDRNQMAGGDINTRG